MSRPRALPRTSLVRVAALLVALAAAVPAPSLASPVPSPWVLPAGVSRIVNSSLEIGGDVTIPSGATLWLNNTTVTFTGSPGQTLTVLGGGTFVVERSVLQASGGPGHWFGLRGEAGSRLLLSECSVDGVGSAGAAAPLQGIYLHGTLNGVLDCTIRNAPVGLVMDGLTETAQIERVAFESTATDILVVNGSRVKLLDTPVATMSVEDGSQVCLDFSLTVRTVTSWGDTVPLVDVEVRDGADALYASAGFGGTDPPSRESLRGDPLFPAVRAPALCQLGQNTTQLHPLSVSAKHGDWQESRNLTLSRSTVETFVPAPRTTTFTNVTALGGVEGSSRFDGESFGPGAAWGDFDRDGCLDLYVTDSATMGVFQPLHKGPNFLYRSNCNGTFTEVSREVGAAYNGSWGAAWADYDNDGDLDLYLTNYGSGETFYSPGAPNVLFNNLRTETGVARFEDVTAFAGVAGQGHSTSAGWADYDGDGWLDLYVANLGIMNHMTWWLRNESNVLYRNNRDGTFKDVTVEAGMVTGGGSTLGMGGPQQFVFVPTRYNGSRTDYTTDWVGDIHRDIGPSGMSFAVAWFDTDADGDLDLLVGNDHGMNAFYRNLGDGTFRDDTIPAGFGRIGAAMGFAVGDYDGDGDLDVYQPNFNLDYLWRNRGDGTFEEVSSQAGLENVLVGWGTAFLDFDNDGDLDLFVANGRVYMNDTMFGGAQKPALQMDRLYRNDGNGRFTEVSGPAGLDNNLNSMGAAVADYDRDGDLDIFVGNTDGPELLLRNEAQGQDPKSWLEIELVGVVSNRDAVGAKVTVEAGGRSFLREHSGGTSFLTQNPSILHFGLGNATSIDAVDVTWPSGLQTRLENVTPDQVLTLKEEAPFVASAGPDLAVDEDAPVGLDASGTRHLSPDGEFRRSLSWTWVDGGGPRTVEGARPTVTFADPGVYDLTLAADDLAGTRLTDSLRVTVRDRTPPWVDLGPDLVVDEGATVSFDLSNATDNDRAFPLGAAYKFEVVGPAGTQVSLGFALSVTLLAPGLYSVKASVTDAGANTGSDRVRVRVRDLTPPLLEVSPERHVRAGELLLLVPDVLWDNDPEFNTTGAVTWSFAVGDDCRVPVTIFGRQLVYRIETPGTYAVTVNATDASGHTTLRSVVLVVEGTGLAGGGEGVPALAVPAGAAAALAAAAAVVLVRRRRQGAEKP